MKHTPGLVLNKRCVYNGVKGGIPLWRNTSASGADGRERLKGVCGVSNVTGKLSQGGDETTPKNARNNGRDMTSDSGSGGRMNTMQGVGNTISKSPRKRRTSGEQNGYSREMLPPMISREYIEYTAENASTAGPKLHPDTHNPIQGGSIMSNRGRKEESTRRQISSCVS